MYFGRFSSVHIGDPSANQVTSLESQPIHTIQEVSKRTLSDVFTGSEYKMGDVHAANTEPPSDETWSHALDCAGALA